MCSDLGSVVKLAVVWDDTDCSPWDSSSLGSIVASASICVRISSMAVV